MSTEALHPDALYFDKKSITDRVAFLAADHRAAFTAVERAVPCIGRATELAVARIQSGGRLIYVGAGTSGRLALLDAIECGPTFDMSDKVISAVLAGGHSAILHSIEGAEDNMDDARYQMRIRALGKRDVVCGLAASGTTPFTLAALAYAKQKRASTVIITCGDIPCDKDGKALADIAIQLDTGPEVPNGSTRMKAGTAQKMTLNFISTVIGSSLGKMYGGLMVDVRATNTKLKRRAVNIVRRLTGIPPDAAESLLSEANWYVKTAVVMQRCAVTRDTADSLLREHAGNLRSIIGDVDYLRMPVCA